MNSKTTGLPEDLSDSETSLPHDMLFASMDIDVPPDATELPKPTEKVQPQEQQSRGRPRRRSAEKAQSRMTKSKPKPPKRKRPPKPQTTGTPHHTGPFRPIRDYYHSTSFLKIKDNEWEKDVDSDDELDHSWLIELETSVSIVSIWKTVLYYPRPFSHHLMILRVHERRFMSLKT